MRRRNRHTQRPTCSSDPLQFISLCVALQQQVHWSRLAKATLEYVLLAAVLLPGGKILRLRRAHIIYIAHVWLARRRLAGARVCSFRCLRAQIVFRLAYKHSLVAFLSWESSSSFGECRVLGDVVLRSLARGSLCPPTTTSSRGGGRRLRRQRRKPTDRKRVRGDGGSSTSQNGGGGRER
jgi:hypothetical protein